MNRGWRDWAVSGFFDGRGCPIPAAVAPGGGLLALPPAYLAFSLLFCPHPPSPLPLRGRGRFLVDFAGGFAPGTPAAEPIGLRKTDKKRSLRVIPPPTEAPVRQGQPVPRPVQPWGCKGRSPRRNNLWGSPFPAGEGGWGDGGQQSKLKAGQGGGKAGKPPAGYNSRVPRQPESFFDRNRCQPRFPQ